MSFIRSTQFLISSFILLVASLTVTTTFAGTIMVDDAVGTPVDVSSISFPVTGATPGFGGSASHEELRSSH